MNIIKIVRQLRYFNAALLEILPIQTIKKIKKESRYVIIDPGEIDESKSKEEWGLSFNKTELQMPELKN